jgi:quercetin dioxygenase-like cupin family protein
MKTEIAGITRANEGIQGISWSILGQTYVPKTVTEHSFSWHATFPPETFVPPHIHPDQDEYLYILEGKLDFFLDGADTQATPGDLVRLPMGKPHGIFNKSGRTAKTLFWVSPTRRLYDLFWAIHNMKEQTPDAVVALAAEHNIHFLPPPRGGFGCSGRRVVAQRNRGPLPLPLESRIALRSIRATKRNFATPAPLPAPAAAVQNPPSTHSRARSLRAGRGSAPSRYR